MLGLLLFPKTVPPDFPLIEESESFCKILELLILNLLAASASSRLGAIIILPGDLYESAEAVPLSTSGKTGLFISASIAAVISLLVILYFLVSGA
ncbi:MAG TPA: hypothetical protein PLP33_27515 [Leptospiraceae bacterium]|nr:hypothetical protein [Leptospiraceae bacterium]